MTVKELRLILNKLSSKTEVVTVTGVFNQLISVEAVQDQAFIDEDGNISLTKDKTKDVERIRVLIIS